MSLDALRAVDAWLPVSGATARIDRDRIVYWGWSEGGYAALVSDRWAPTWAPDYAPVGVVAAVPLVDLRGQLAVGAATWGPAAQAGALMLAAQSRWHGGDLGEVLQPDVAAAIPAEIEASCTSWPTVSGAGAVDALYTTAWRDAMAGGGDLDPWTCWVDASSVSSPEVPYAGAAPMMIVTGEADTLVPEAPVRDAIPALCAEGYAITHVSCTGAEHGEAPLQTLGAQIGWMDARSGARRPRPGARVPPR